MRSAQLNRRHALFSIYRLGLLEDPPEARVLAHLEDLAPVGDVLAAFLRPWLRRPSVAGAIAEFLEDSERNTSAYLSTWLIAAMAERKGDLPMPWVRYGRDVAQDANQPAFHRAIAMSLMARGKQRGDIDWLQRTARASYEPTVLRGALAALFRVGSLDSGTRSLAEAHVPSVGKTVRYLGGRAALPSLIKRGQLIAVDA